MTAVPECTHGMPSPASCVDCMADGPVAPPARVEPERPGSGTWPAQFEGTCPDCVLPITVGQRIHRSSAGRYFHERCAP